MLMVNAVHGVNFEMDALAGLSQPIALHPLCLRRGRPSRTQCNHNLFCHSLNTAYAETTVVSFHVSFESATKVGWTTISFAGARDCQAERPGIMCQPLAKRVTGTPEK